MLNIIWIAMMIIALLCGIYTGRINDIVKSVTDSTQLAIDISLGLIGVMALWSGLMKIAEDSGIVTKLAQLLKPIMIRLFPDVPPEHPAMGAMMMNMTANLLGLGNAATPLGLRAMQHLESLNKSPGIATDAMCMFLAINTSSIQLIPVTAIAYLAANGATHPTDVIASALIATMCSTIAAIIAAKIFARLPIFKLKLMSASV